MNSNITIHLPICGRKKVIGGFLKLDIGTILKFIGSVLEFCSPFISVINYSRINNNNTHICTRQCSMKSM